MPQANLQERIEPKLQCFNNVAAEITTLLQGVVLVPWFSATEAIITGRMPYYCAGGGAAASLIATMLARDCEDVSERRALRRYATYFATGTIIGLLPQVHSLVQQLAEYATR